MKKTLVVMRHGKAMPCEQGQNDKDRKLTTAGIMALEARLPYMLRLFEANGNTAQVWASPAKRARQSAGLLKKALQKNHVKLAKGLEIHDSLWEQDVEAFLQDLRSSASEYIFAVGHVPFVEEIVDELTGATPAFSTGALACMELHLADADNKDDKLDQDKARLLWFAQGPVAARWETLNQFQAIMSSTVDAIEERRNAFFATPTDTETIHRFRTNIRTLRSFLAFIKPWQDARQNATTQEILKEVVRYTSLLRELDVLEKQVRANPDSSAKLIAFCEKEASAERAKVLKILGSKRVSRIFKKAMELSRNIVWRQQYVERGLPKEAVRARFDVMVESVKVDLAVVKISDDEQTHDVRKRAKRARYVAEFSPALLGEDALVIAKGMMAHQDILGDVCDARANIRLISGFLERDLPKSVKRDLTRMREQNEDFLKHALKEHA